MPSIDIEEDNDEWNYSSSSDDEEEYSDALDSDIDDDEREKTKNGDDKFTPEESLELVKYYCGYGGSWDRLRHSFESKHLFFGRTLKYCQQHISSIKTQAHKKFATYRGTKVRDSIVRHLELSM